MVFGTGVLLRGLVADVAERAGLSLTMVSQTPSGDGRARALVDAGGAFSLKVRGLRPNGAPIDTVREVRSIESALSATDEWESVLALALDPDVELVVSNVSESGFKLTEPIETSFPTRLASWLRARWRANLPGVTVLPTELIAGNGSKLRAMVGEVAPGAEFSAWLDAECRFCDTLVDRICTQDDADPLAAIVEPYSFWAIQGEKTGVLKTLEESSGGEIVVAPNISHFAARKVRILNGLHTAMASVGPAKYGVETVREALEHPELGPFLEALLNEEILPAICPPLDEADAGVYAKATLNRMRNPFLVHKLSAIAVGAPAKWETRLLPTMIEYGDRFGKKPERLTACREAFLETST